MIYNIVEAFFFFFYGNWKRKSSIDNVYFSNNNKYCNLMKHTQSNYINIFYDYHIKYGTIILYIYTQLGKTLLRIKKFFI